MSRFPPNQSPKPDPKPKPKPLDQAEADFTAEGSPPPGKVGKRVPAVALNPGARGSNARRDAASKSDPKRSAERGS